MTLKRITGHMTKTYYWTYNIYVLLAKNKRI